MTPRFWYSLVPPRRGCAAPPHASQWLEGVASPRKVGVDDLIKKLVLGGTWRRHGDLDLSEKHLETRKEDFVVVLWSKPSGDYIMNFDQPKAVLYKKTESGGHMRWPQGRGRPPPLWSPRASFGLLLIFLIF